MIATWPCPVPEGTAEEFALAFDDGRARRVLMVPALFDEANRLRRLTVETMRRLDRLGLDSFLPDLPGTNESRVPGVTVTLDHWRAAMIAAARHFGATHAIAIRGGALIRPDLPGADYAPVKGATILRQMLRMRVLASREAGREEKAEPLLEQAMADGIVLAGYPMGPAMVRQLNAAQPGADCPVIAQGDIGGAGLWLRAEPGEDAAQADALAARIAAKTSESVDE